MKAGGVTTMAEDHLAAIRSGAVTKTNVIGIRKAFNTWARQCGGWSTGRTSPKVSTRDINRLGEALETWEPKVTGELHDTGVKLLRSPRFRKRLERVADVVADPQLSFSLIGFDMLGRREEYAVPVYRARGAGRYFDFRNVPWQSGGDGPEVVQ